MTVTDKENKRLPSDRPSEGFSALHVKKTHRPAFGIRGVCLASALALSARHAVALREGGLAKAG